jgi:hypothetical protein
MKNFSLITLLALVFAEAAFAAQKCPPLKCNTGFIQAKFNNGTSPGFISKFFLGNVTTLGVYTTSKTTALKVKLPSTNVRTSLSKTLFDIKSLNGVNASLPWLGAAVAGGLISPSSGGFSFITATQKSAVGPPTGVTAYAGEPGESQIWKLDCQKHFSAHWINVDGTTFPTTFFDLKVFLPPTAGIKTFGSNVIGITANLTASEALVSAFHAAPITLTFVPQCA